MSLTDQGLIATCWTSAGNARPLDASERSPFSPLDRLHAAADSGFSGLGFAREDLEVISDTIGFEEFRRRADSIGIDDIQVELASDWWFSPEERPWRSGWQSLLKAARALRSPWIKIGTAQGAAAVSISPFVGPLRRIADEAAAMGTSVALEPLPFALISSLPQGAQLVAAVDHEKAGLIVDYWHVFRAGTGFDELRDAVLPSMIFGIELDDADLEPVGTLFEDTRDNRRYPGEGAQDVVGFIETMVDLGWSGPWGVEILSNEHRAKSLRDALLAARDSTLRCLAQVDAAAGKNSRS